MRFLVLILGALATLAAAGASGGGIRRASTQRSISGALPFSLTFNGEHVTDPNLPAGIRHQGRFTASAPVCPAGTASDTRDVQLEPLSVLRAYTCDDGSGSFTAAIPLAASEHSRSGRWMIVAGTGSYAALRGIGTYTGALLSGDPNDFLSIKFRTEWRGAVGFDVAPPSVGVRAVAHRLAPRRYALRIALRLGDESGPISYHVDVGTGATFLVARSGKTASATPTILRLRVRPSRGTHTLVVKVDALDAVGNEGKGRTAVRLFRAS
jgi:hypothetical protein